MTFEQIRLQLGIIRRYKNSMQVSKAMAMASTPTGVIGLSVALLVLAAIFGVLNKQKIKALHTHVANADAARDAAELKRLDDEKKMKAREATVAAAAAKVAETEGKVSKAEAELVQLQTEKVELQTKLQANQAEVAAMQKRVEEAGARPADPGAPTVTEMQAQLDEARRQLENAERENAFLSEKIHSTQERSTQLEEEKKRRDTGVAKAGVRGTVLAVNQAYNFVVLNLGGRQGVEPNAEMLVLRDGTPIGKIRVSSVEPSTAIGDIITSSLARGVQVQPGDIVIYAGTS
jgi:hypothetical protein